MEGVIERIVSSNSKCYSCGGIVYAVEKKKTTNHVYHKQCFRCRICKRTLTESSLNEEGNDIYCANCYRRKQLGDCHGIDFLRAAAERAQYVHNEHHSEQTRTTDIPRTSTRSDSVRNHPSWTLRQIERRLLTSLEPLEKDSESTDRNYQKLLSSSYRTTIKTNFVQAANLKTTERNLLFTTDELLKSRHLPVFSLNSRSSPGTVESFNSSDTKDTYVQVLNTATNAQSNALSRTRYDNADIHSTASTPIMKRRPSVVIQVKKEDRKPDKASKKVQFSDNNITPVRSRSKSVHASFQMLKRSK